MRSGWNRATAVLDLTTEVVEALVGKAIPDAKVVGFQAVDGGLANTNFKVQLEQPEASGPSSVLLKIFVRDPEAAPKEYALNQLVCQRVCTAGGILPHEWRKMSLLTDLTAWTKFMTRETVNDNLIADAIKVIEKTIQK